MKETYAPMTDEQIDRYDPAIQRIIRKALKSEPPPRKNGLRARDSHGRRTVQTVGHAENPEAPAGTVDFRHHRSRIEKGK